MVCAKVPTIDTEAPAGFKLAVTVAVPFLSPVATPVELTVNLDASEDDQVAVLVMSAEVPLL